MHFVFVQTLSIESGNSSLLKLQREMYSKFQVTKGREAHSQVSEVNGTRDKIPPDPHSSLLLC